MAAFDNREDIERWLQGRSQADAMALAIRAALRAAPALRTIIGPSILGHGQNVDAAQLYFAFVANAWVQTSSTDPLHFYGDRPFDEVRSSAALKNYAEAAQTAFQTRTWDFLAAARAASASRLAYSAVAASGLEATRFAVHAASDAAIAASLTVNDFQPSRTAAQTVFSACAADATALEMGVDVDQLFEQPLWPNGAPPWVKPNWRMIRAYLSIQDENRIDWGRWYDRRLRGAPLGRDPPEAHLRDLALRPAAIEPIWRGDRLTLSDRLSHSQDGEELMLAKFTALREELIELADDTALQPNCDPRASEYLSKLACRIPTTTPSKVFLLRLENARDSARYFLKTVEREWPDLHVSRFRALLLQFDRTLEQFPNLRHFEVGEDGVALTEKQIKRASEVSKAVADVLENDGRQDWLDPKIASALRTIEEPLVETEAAVGLSQKVAHDLLESVSNILKAVIEGAVVRLAPVADWTRSTAIESGKAFADHARTSLIDEAAKAGDKVGPSIGKVLKGLRVAAVLGCGAAVLPIMPWLIESYPVVFGWLESFLSFIERL